MLNQFTETERVTLEELRDRVQAYWLSLGLGTRRALEAQAVLDDIEDALAASGRYDALEEVGRAAADARLLSGRAGRLGAQAAMLVHDHS